MEQSTVIADQRTELDRRQFSWRTVAYGFLRSRRHVHRRVSDEEVIFLDWHHPWLFFLATGTMLLSCADAFLTLILLSKGAVELNIFMDILIQKDIQLFTIVKMAVTGTALIVLVMHFNFRVYRIIAVRYVIYAFVPLYMLLVAHEINLLYRI